VSRRVPKPLDRGVRDFTLRVRDFTGSCASAPRVGNPYTLPMHSTNADIDCHRIHHNRVKMHAIVEPSALSTLLDIPPRPTASATGFTSPG